MTNEELKTRIASIEPSFVFEESSGWLTILTEPDKWKQLAVDLRSTIDLYFDYLFCLTCVDWKTHMTMVYHLTSTTYRHTIAVKIKLDRTNPRIPTVSDIWRTAEFHEREVYDLFGVSFTDHPDLRRLLLTDEWEGWPLRKDYEDPVNMIKL
jgi:NADH:ubiquinone oxidoreductase subunit C